MKTRSPANILLITSDQQHWQMLGAHSPQLKTPNLDRLAAQGTRFDRAYCPNPTCTPSRASLITGLYPSQHGAYALGTRLPEDVPTVGKYLQEAGYDCSLIGKAHFQPLRGNEEFPSLEAYPILQDLKFWRGFHGPFYGFNHVELARNHADEAHVGQHYAIWMEENGGQNWRDWFRPPTGKTPNQRHRWNIPEKFHGNAWITDRAAARLENAEKQKLPFFLWASYFDPHPPYLVPEPWASMYDPALIELPPQGLDDVSRWPELMRRTQMAGSTFEEWQEAGGSSIHGAEHHRLDADTLRQDIAIYYGMVSMLDHYIGKLLNRLEELGLAENTLVVFTSDHGHYFGQHGLAAKGPFHFEDGVKVPMMVRWPGQVPAGRISNALQSLVDYTPSFLDAAGLPMPGHMAGKTQVPLWKGDASAARTEVTVEFRHQPTKLNLRTYIDARYKLTIWNNPTDGELYDLEIDPGEHRNLWSDPKAGDLKARLLQQALLIEMEKEPYRMPRLWGHEKGIAMSKKTSLSRGLAVLESVSLADRPLRFSELRTVVSGVPDSTLSRLLRSLEGSGHLARLPEIGYAPGPEIRRWMKATQRAPKNFQEMAVEQVRMLTTAAQESAAVALLGKEAVRIVRSQTVPDAVAILAEGLVLDFEADHAASLAILHQLDGARRAKALQSRYSRIRSLEEYKAAVKATRRNDNFWLDCSLGRPGICRLALGFSNAGRPGAVFFCLTIEAARKHQDVLRRALRVAQGALQD